MKKLVYMVLSLMPALAIAVDPASVNRSSYIAGVTQSSCIINVSYLDKIIVGEATSGGNIAIYSSSWTMLESQRISSVTLATVGMYDFGNAQVRSGICYLADTPTNGVTILYKK